MKIPTLAKKQAAMRARESERRRIERKKKRCLIKKETSSLLKLITEAMENPEFWKEAS